MPCKAMRMVTVLAFASAICGEGISMESTISSQGTIEQSLGRETHLTNRGWGLGKIATIIATLAATMHTADARAIRLGPATFDQSPYGKAQMRLGLATFSQAFDGGVNMQVEARSFSHVTVHRTRDGNIEASLADDSLADPTDWAVEELTGMTTQQLEDMMVAGESILKAAAGKSILVADFHDGCDALDDTAKAWVRETSTKLEATVMAAANIMRKQVRAYAKQAAIDPKQAAIDVSRAAIDAKQAAIDATAYETAYAKEATAEAMLNAQDQATKLKPKVLAAGQQKADDVQAWAVNMEEELKAWAAQKTTELKPMLDRVALKHVSNQVLADANRYADEELNKLAAEVTNAVAAKVLYDLKRQADDELKPKLAEEGKKAMAQVTSWFNDKVEVVGVAVGKAFGTKPEAFIKEAKEKFEAAVKK